MSTMTNDYYYNALLAQAAYGDFSNIKIDALGNLIEKDVEEALEKSGSEFTEEQAK